MKQHIKLPHYSPDYAQNKKKQKKCLLMYSGGVDTSISVYLLQKYYGYEVITATIDLGQNFQDPKIMGEKALKLGAIKHITVKAEKEFAQKFVLKALWANALYDEKYCLSTSIARPMTAQKAIETAKKEHVAAIAHGCKGRGADAFRLNMVFHFLAPDFPVVLPIHDWNPTRSEEAAFAYANTIPIPVAKDNPFSYDENLWGVAINYGSIDAIEKSVPEEAYKWTVPVEKAPEKGELVEVTFESGVPVAVNKAQMDLVSLISTLNKLGGKHGVGRKDMIENGLYGNKFRWVYESPGAEILITAHKELEKVVLPKESLYFKEQAIDKKWAELAYNSFWYSPIMDGLNAFIAQTQQYVTGSVTLKLYKGNVQIVKRSSPNSLIKSVVKDVKDMVPFGYEEYLFLHTHPEHIKEVL